MWHKKKGAIVRRLRPLPPRAVPLAADETLLRWFPPLRNCWSLQGQQAVVLISGRNDKRVLMGAIDLRTGHRVVLLTPNQRQGSFHNFLRELRRHYPGRPIYLLLDRLSIHTAPRTQALAARLNIHLLWLPRQHPELNPVDHLYKELKGKLAANRQFQTMRQEGNWAQTFVKRWTNRQALCKAGLLSKRCWLRKVCKNFCTPT